MPYLIYVNTSTAVSDADGDVVRCRWANSSLSECAGVCQTFPATLDEVGQTFKCNSEL